MEHIVFFPSAEGSPAFQRVGSLEEAISFVERLRNTADVSDFSVHALTPVPLAVKAYYRIEVPAQGRADEPAAQAAEAATPAPAPVTETVEVFEPVAAAEPVAAVEPMAAEPAVLEVDVDRAEEWVAEAPVVEPPAVAPAAEVQPVPPFAEPTPVPDGPGEASEQPVAGDVAEVGSQDVIPVPTGRRSMGFFAR